MIDYAFGALDDTRRAQFEIEVSSDPQLAAKLDRLNRNLNALVDDGETYEPPADLAERTLVYVRSARPRRSLIDLVPVSVPFRWADVAVAAGIFLAGLVTLLPAVHRSRIQTDQAVCSFNLFQLGQGLASYSTVHGCYPYPPPDSPIPYAGIFKVMLHDAGHLWDPAVLDCPSNGRGPLLGGLPLPDYKTLCSMQDQDPKQFRRLLCGDYAYHLGYRHPENSGHPGPIPARLKERVALLADGPSHDDRGNILAGNSPNHAGLGQNVLFSDGHVGWYDSRSLGPNDSDMFLNAERRAEPGVSLFDAVLAPGVVPFFDGR
jgi:prepilin-type processing-associated H-X9-DG protein